jgi:molybdopterin-guanine dinucleotide biosynthesis protein A
MSNTFAGIILAGGLNTRMGGRNKAFMAIEGNRFLDRIIDVMETVFEERFLVTRCPSEYESLELNVVQDIFPVRSPLTGIHAGLKHSKADHAFCTACDTPFLKAETIRILLDEIEDGFEVVVPASGRHFQPLCAVYSRRCIDPIEKQLFRGHPKVNRLYDQLNVKKIPYERFRSADPALNSFFNINTTEDLEKAGQVRLMRSPFDHV